MTNYLDLIEVWEAVRDGYTPKYNADGTTLTTESQLLKGTNNNAVNAILNSVSEQVAMIFTDTTSAKAMWNALINRYEGNTQIKRTKINGLETQFENFRVHDHESMEEIYSRLMEIQNQFCELGEPLTNNKLVGKLLRAMMKRPRWESMVSALEAIQGTRDTFTLDELYTQLRCFEEKLKQAGEQKSEPKALALPAHNIKHFNPSSSQPNRETLIQRLDHEVSKDALLLSKMFQGMLDFEKKYNKEREEREKKVVCFMCQREGHTIQSCFKLFPHLKSNDEDKLERKGRFKRDFNKGKKKAKALNAMWSDDSDESNNEKSDSESDHGKTNLALMAIDDIEESIDIDSIIASKNITDPITLSVLKSMAISRGATYHKEQMEEVSQEETSTSTKVEEVFHKTQNYFSCLDSSDDEFDCVIEPIISKPSMDEPSTFSNKELFGNEIDRLNELVTELRKELVEKDVIVSDLICEIGKLRNEVKSTNDRLEEEKGILNKTKRDFEALKSTRLYKCGVYFDVEQMYKGQGPHDKSGLGFKENQSSFGSKNQQGQKKYWKPNSSYNKKPKNVNYAFKYNYRFNKENRTCVVNGVKRFYNKNNNGWYYNTRHRTEHGRIQSNVSISQVASKQMWVVKNSHQKKNGNLSKQNFSKKCTVISNEKITKAFCNYCSHHGHISIECPFKNTSNLSKVAWVLKRTN